MMIDFMNNIRATPELFAIYEGIQRDSSINGYYASNAQESMEIN